MQVLHVIMALDLMAILGFMSHLEPDTLAQVLHTMMGLERMERMRIFTDELTAVASPTFRSSRSGTLRGSPAVGRRTGDGAEAEAGARRSPSFGGNSGSQGWQGASPVRSNRGSATEGATESDEKRRLKPPPWLRSPVRVLPPSPHSSGSTCVLVFARLAPHRSSLGACSPSAAWYG